MSSKVIAGLGAKQTPNTAELPIGRIMTKVAEKLCMERGWKIHTNGDTGAAAYFEMGLSEEARASHPDAALRRFLPEQGYNGHAQGIVAEREDLLRQARTLLGDLPAIYPEVPRFISLDGTAREVLTPEELALCRLHTRLVFQLFGETLDQPVTMVVCWTPDGAIDAAGFKPEATGSTGLAIALAQLKGIPVFNLQRPDHLKRICTFIGEPVPEIA